MTMCPNRTDVMFRSTDGSRVTVMSYQSPVWPVPRFTSQNQMACSLYSISDNPRQGTLAQWSKFVSANTVPSRTKWASRLVIDYSVWKVIKPHQGNSLICLFSGISMIHLGQKLYSTTEKAYVKLPILFSYQPALCPLCRTRWGAIFSTGQYLM